MILICVLTFYPIVANTSQGSIKFSSRSRPPTEPTSSTNHLWVGVLWKRLERVMDDVANCCIKVYTLEKVLRIKRDTLTQVEFFDEVMKASLMPLSRALTATDL